MSQPLVQLTPHLWAGQSRLYHTNHGVFLSKGQACLIDPGIFPDEVEAVARFVEAQGATVSALILTHSHWDHILGPERFPGLRVVAQATYLTQARERGDATLRVVAAWEKENGIERDALFAMPTPTETFEETATLALDNLTLRLIHAPGHAPDQLVVYHAESATLWAADMLSDLEIPFVSHDLEAYRRTLAGLSTLDIQALVPGHGHATSEKADVRNRLSEDIAYLDELRSRVEAAVRQGDSMEEAVALCADMTYRNRGDNAGPHRWNVESAYVALGDVREREKVGWEQEEE